MVAALPVQSHLSTLATDPIRNFKFLVQISHNAPNTNSGKNAVPIDFKLGFTSVSGFSATTNAIPYRQGGYNTTPQMIPGQTSFTPISFQRGVLLGNDYDWGWFRQLFAVTTGQGNFDANAGQVFRAKVTVSVLPHPRTDVSAFEPVAQFVIYNAWPTSISFSDLNAGDNAFVVSSMTLAHEGWNFTLASSTDNKITTGSHTA